MYKCYVRRQKMLSSTAIETYISHSDHHISESLAQVKLVWLEPMHFQQPTWDQNGDVVNYQKCLWGVHLVADLNQNTELM